MKNLLFAGAAALLLASGSAYGLDEKARATDDKTSAATSTTSDDATKHHHWTLAEARQHAHEWAGKLDKMSESEWAEHEKHRDEWFAKWHTMTPEEKEAYKKNKAAKHHKAGSGDDAVKAPSPAPADPAPPSNQ